MVNIDTKKHPTISFLISTYNAANQLETCLRSIRSQNYPQEKIEILIADGGSADSTLDIAKDYNVIIYNNPRRLAEYGLAINAKNSNGDFLVITAADNELKGQDWLLRMLMPFLRDERVSAEWGRLISSKGDCAINNYYALIQNDPLTYFSNQNLRIYLRRNKLRQDNGEKYYIFDASPGMPLPWGANCLVYRARDVKHFWNGTEYIGDNDIFQMMLEAGKTRIAYNGDLHIYHHTVGTLFDWIGKWRRNMGKHFLRNRQTRNLNWINVKYFKLKLLLWIIYSFLLPLSFLHAVYLALREKNIYWLYHPLASLAQTVTYLYVIFTTKMGWKLIFDFLNREKL